MRGSKTENDALFRNKENGLGEETTNLDGVIEVRQKRGRFENYC